jgi:hypothetical protein
MARARKAGISVTPLPATPVTPPPYQLHSREWDRATELIKLFVATGWVENARPQSIIFRSDPGSGKTELIERFMSCNQLAFASDLTVRGLYTILRKAEKRIISHLVATEFQKFLMRKASTAENMLGTLTQALEEGVGEVYIGDKLEDFRGARVGIIGAITAETLNKKRDMLREVGFLSRVAIFHWRMPDAELQDVMRRISRGDQSDLAGVHMAMPEKPIPIDMHEKLSDVLRQYVWRDFRDHTVLRVFQRFRALAMASAALESRTVVNAWDVERVMAFHPYWKIMERG